VNVKAIETVEQAWQTYNDTVLPKTASPTQRIETRRAFQGGAWAILNMLIAHADDDEEIALARIKQWHRECIDFRDAVVKGEA